jgi:hypothetical protein
MLTFDDLDTWLDEIAALTGVRSAVLDPAQLILPGVWCQVPSFGVDTLAAGQYRLDVQLYLAVSDQDWKSARRALATLFDTVHGHLGRPRLTQVPFLKLVLPEGQEVPCLRIPYTLRLVPDPIN